jgi:hypothetical protein
MRPHRCRYGICEYILAQASIDVLCARVCTCSSLLAHLGSDNSRFAIRTKHNALGQLLGHRLLRILPVARSYLSWCHLSSSDLLWCGCGMLGGFKDGRRSSVRRNWRSQAAGVRTCPRIKASLNSFSDLTNQVSSPICCTIHGIFGIVMDSTMFLHSNRSWYRAT